MLPETPKRTAPLQLDIKGIIRKRLSPAKRRLIPSPLLKTLENLIHQDELNALLRATFPNEGSAFSAALLRELDIRLEVTGAENLPDSGKLIFASNHPLGGMDGITLIKVLGEKYGDSNLRVVVNDMLMNVEPLGGVFLPINKYGSQARDAALALNEAYASDKQICIFPAGLVSRLHPDGTVSDLVWQKSVVAKAIEFERDIVPIRFVALNTPRFYRLARMRKKAGIRVNIEQALLPSELCKARGSHFRIIIGKPVTSAALRSITTGPGAKSLMETAAMLREEVYRLFPPERL